MHKWARGRTIGIACGALLGSALAAQAGLLDVAGASTVWLGTGDQLEVEISIANFARDNPGAPAPLQLMLQLLAPAAQGPLAVLPGSTAQYYSGFAMQGEVPLDAGGDLRLVDGAAARAGLGDDALLLGAGSLATGAGARPIAMVSGSTPVEPLSGLAGQTVLRILLTNLGDGLLLGAGDGYTLRTSLWLEAAGALGSAQTTGIVESAWVHPGAKAPGVVPEPNSGALALAPLAAAALLIFGYYLLTRAWTNLSSKNGCRTTSSR